MRASRVEEDKTDNVIQKKATGEEKVIIIQFGKRDEASEKMIMGNNDGKEINKEIENGKVQGEKMRSINMIEMDR